MAKHSSLVGGSTAARILQCPGSWKATMALPPTADRSSPYAEEGTFAHSVMERLLLARQTAPEHGIDLFDRAGKMLSQKFHDRNLAPEHLDEMIFPALAALADLEQQYGGNFDVADVEARVVFPGLLSAFGTVDLLLRSPTHVLVVDYKFGQGVPVRATYADEHGETANPQLMFYLAAAMNSRKSLFTGKRKLVIAVVQPRTEEPLTHAEVTRSEVKWFVEDIHGAVLSAMDRDPPRHRGEACRFAPCKVDCPLWTGPMLDLSSFGIAPVATPAVPTPAYGDYLAKAKALVDMLALYSKEVNEQLHNHLRDGGRVPGWKLKLKAKQRQWVDEDTVHAALRALGFHDDQIFQRKLATFAATDAVAKHIGVKIPPELRIAPPSTDTTVCPESDPAPAVEPARVIEEFAASLRLLTR